MEVTLAADWHEASLLHMLFMLHSLGGGFASAIWRAQDLRIIGGTHALSLAAAGELGDRVIRSPGIRDHRSRRPPRGAGRGPAGPSPPAIARAAAARGPLALRPAAARPPRPALPAHAARGALKAVSFYQRPSGASAGRTASW